jgi:hypothetical protein
VYKTWIKEELAFLREAYPDMDTKTIAEILGRSAPSVSRKACSMGLLKSPEYTHNLNERRAFKPGQVPWNAGKPGYHMKTIGPQHFKKGNVSGAAKAGEQPVGTEKVNYNGYRVVKVSSTGKKREKWKYAHHLVWEQNFGPIPEGQIVVFKNRDKTDLRPENLECIDRKQHAASISIANYPPELRSLIAQKGHLTRELKKHE